MTNLYVVLAVIGAVVTAMLVAARRRDSEEPYILSWHTKEEIENLRTARTEFFEHFQRAKQVTLIHQKTALPWIDLVTIPPEDELIGVRLQMIFEVLEIQPGKLKRIYTTQGVVRGKNKVLAFTGKFEPRGKQALADILDKNVVFAECIPDGRGGLQVVNRMCFPPSKK